MKTDWVEVQDLILSILVLGFCFSFRHWGEPFSWEVGASSFVLITFLVAFSFFVHEIVHRIIARNSQADLRYRAWKFGLLLAVIIVFITNGWFIFAAVGVITIVSHTVHRPGKAKPGWGSVLGPYERAKIAISGPITNFALAIFSMIMFKYTTEFLWSKLFTINAWLAVMNLFPFFRSIPYTLTRKMLPASVAGKLQLLNPRRAFIAEKRGDERLIPGTEGEVVFFGSKPMWIFAFMFVLVSCILLALIKKVIISLVLGFIVGAIFYILWQYYLEKWPGKKPYQY